ncbi:MAG: DUF1573 domain-containing protein [Pirellulaceae bacterium]|nr:DUF1573 domain-containing protein [Pirellulaceae bacterium]
MGHYSTILALLVAFSIDAVAQESVKPANTFFTLNLIADKTYDAKIFELGVVPPGSILKAKVYIHNDSGKTVQFQKVNVGCKCTTALVPEVTLLAGEFTETSYEFSTEKNPRETEETYTATIACTGGRDTIRLSFRAEFDGVVAFQRPDFLLPFLEDSPEVSFRLPLNCKSIDLRLFRRICGAKLTIYRYE